MSKIESLAILATDAGNDFLAEKYGVVIDNITTGTISSQLKNKDLSGDPTSGTVEAKRFCNSKSAPYGTARAGGKGDKVKAKPVTVAINKDDEIIEEVEEKDVSMYGVEGLVERRTANHELVMRKDLEKEFFLCAAVNSDVFTTIETEINKIVEKAIQKVEKTKNSFVDGVPRELISVTFDTGCYGDMLDFFDKTPNTADYSAQEGMFRMFHKVRCFSSTDLPEGVKFIVMVDGAVAQPVKPTVCPCKKIEFSNAYGFGVFYSHGATSVMPDLTLVYGSTELEVNVLAGADATHTAIEIADKVNGASYLYKTGATSAVTVPTVGSKASAVTGYTEYTGVEISAASGNKIAVIEVNANGVVSRVTAKLDVVLGA